MTTAMYETYRTQRLTHLPSDDMDECVSQLGATLYLGNTTVDIADVPQLIGLLAGYLDEGGLSDALTDIEDRYGIEAMRIEAMP